MIIGHQADCLIIIRYGAIDLTVRPEREAPIVVGGDELTEYPLTRLDDRRATLDWAIGRELGSTRAGIPIFVGQGQRG